MYIVCNYPYLKFLQHIGMQSIHEDIWTNDSELNY